MSCAEYPQMPACHVRACAWNRPTLRSFRINTKKSASDLHMHLMTSASKLCWVSERGSRKHATVPVIIPIRHCCCYFLAQSDPANFLSILRLRSSTLTICWAAAVWILHLPPYSIHSRVKKLPHTIPTGARYCSKKLNCKPCVVISGETLL